MSETYHGTVGPGTRLETERLITFKVEDSIWQMMAHGEKNWDARKFDLKDERIHKLAWFNVCPPGQIRADMKFGSGVRIPQVDKVGFVNKRTGAVLIFEYLDMKFTPWCGGWCFLILGELVDKKNKQALEAE